MRYAALPEFEKRMVDGARAHPVALRIVMMHSRDDARRPHEPISPTHLTH